MAALFIGALRVSVHWPSFSDIPGGRRIPDRELLVVWELLQQLVGAKAVFVVHGRAFTNVVAQIKPITVQLLCVMDFLQD